MTSGDRDCRSQVGVAAALLVAGWTFAVGATAGAQTRYPAWAVTPAEEVHWIGGDAGHVIILAGDRLERRSLEDGTLVAEQTLSGCSSAFMASRGEMMARLDPVDEPGPGGLVVSCYGGTGQGPLHMVAAIDPVSLAVRWRVDGGARSLSPIAERDGRVLVEWEEPQGDAGVMAIAAASGAVLWTVTVPRVRHDCVDLVGSEDVVLHVSCRGSIRALATDDGRTLWSVTGESLRFASLRAQVVIAGSDDVVVGRSARDGRELWRWEAPAIIHTFLRARDDLVLVETAEIGGGPVAAVHAIERATGLARWTAPLGAHRIVVTAGDHAFVTADTEVQAISLASGSIVARWPATRTVLTRAYPDSVLGLEIVGRADISELQPARVVRFDLTGGLAWRSRPRVHGDALLLAHAGVVATCTGGGSVQTLEESSGAPRWRGAIGLRAASPTDPCRLTIVGDRLVAVGASDSVSVFELAGRARPGARVAVRGRVVGAGAGAGIRVLIGEAWTRTDAEGHFERTVRSAGPITVQIDPPDQQRRCARAEPVQITAQAARRREVVVRLRHDPCACNPCD